MVEKHFFVKIFLVLFFVLTSSLANNQPSFIIGKSYICGISDDGSKFASLRGIWDTKSGEKLYEINEKTRKIYSTQSQASVKNDIVIYSTYSLGKIDIYDIKTGRLILALKGYYPSLSPSGNLISYLPGGESGWEDYVLLDLKSNKFIRRDIKSYNRVRISPDDKIYVIEESERDRIYFYSVSNGSLLKSLVFKNGAMVFSPSGDMFALVSGEKKIDLIDMKNFEIIKSIKTKYSPEKLNINQDSNILVSYAKEGAEVWDINSGARKFALDASEFDIEDVAINGDLVAFASGDLLIWDNKQNEVLAKIDNASAKRLAFSSSGNVLLSSSSPALGYSASDDIDVTIWDMTFYNRDIAQNLYDRIDKSDYIALYTFTTKFADKLDVVQQVYRDIYNAVIKKDTLNAYEWYVRKFKKSLINERDLNGYHLYQKNFDKDSSKELETIYAKYEKLKQKKYAEIFKDVDDEDNLAVYSWFAERFTSPKAADIENAIEKMHQIAFDEVEDIDTLSAYNTFILAYPYAKQVKDANERASELEKDKYTDIGYLGFYNEDKKMNKQAENLLSDIEEIFRQAMRHNGISDYKNIGHYLITQRMLDLALKEFSDTDAIVTFKESKKFKDIKRVIDQKIDERNHNINKIKSGDIDDIIKLRIALVNNVMNDSIADAKMKEFYSSQSEDAREFIDEKEKENEKELKKLAIQEEQFIQERVKSFEELYNNTVNEYESVEHENVKDSVESDKKVVEEIKPKPVASSHSNSLTGIVYGFDPKSVGFLYLRTAPDSSAKDIDKLYNGDSVEIIGKKGEWYNVKYKNKQGWAHSNWIKEKK